MQEANQSLEWEVTGMTCTTCAMTVTKYLERLGLTHIVVNHATNEVKFNYPVGADLDKIKQGINNLGYHVTDATSNVTNWFNLKFKFIFCLLFSLPLLLHMVISWPVLHYPLFQLLLCLPVMAIGFMHFGRSAFASLRNRFPNMDVLIFLGSSSAFLYSLAGTFFIDGGRQAHTYLFYETAATIITLVLLGNLIEEYSVKKTTSALRDLSAFQVATAKKIILEPATHIEKIESVNADGIMVGDLLLVNSGDRVPVDGFIVSGSAIVDESIITGEALPVSRNANDPLVGGTIINDGNIRMRASKVGRDTVLSQIIRLVKDAQSAKPKIQRIGDTVSGYFVIVVLIISLVTFLVNCFGWHIDTSQSLMRAVAVLVISCPCAMGLATPTAVMVGLGIAAKKGILVKGGDTLEQMAQIDTVIFDKTGTLTTGDFQVSEFILLNSGLDETQLKAIIYGIELHSSHPIAKAIVSGYQNWKGNNVEFKSIVEMKGLGMMATDVEGNKYSLGSAKMLKTDVTPQADLYLIRNDVPVVGIRISDQVKSEAHEVIEELKAKGFKVMMLSGDTEEKCKYVAHALGITDFGFALSPIQKLRRIDEIVKSGSGKVCMVGDGINDAPSLAKAAVGVSFAGATEVAKQSAQVVLLHSSLNSFTTAVKLSSRTYSTIKQNLLWALGYNVIAIPLAAAGFLSPMLAAFSMAFSDIVVIGNSLLLKYRK